MQVLRGVLVLHAVNFALQGLNDVVVMACNDVSITSLRDVMVLHVMMFALRVLNDVVAWHATMQRKMKQPSACSGAELRPCWPT